MTIKRRANSTAELDAENRKRECHHVSIIRVNSVDGDFLEDQQTAALDLSNISIESEVIETQSAIAAMADESQSSSPDTTSVPNETLKEILSTMKSIRNENVQLRKTILSLESKVTAIQCKLEQTAPHSPRTDRRREKSVPSNHEDRQHNGHSNPTTQPVPSNHQDQHQRPTANLSDKNLKYKVIPNWGKRFHFRRSQYKDCDKNLKQAAIYSGFVDSSEPYIPKKYRPKFARDEYDFKLSEKNSIQEMRTQIDRWIYYADTHDQKYRDVDRQMYDDLKRHRVKEERDYLQKLWEKEVKNAEEKAEKLNEKECEYMCHLPETDSYSGYVKSATTQSHPNGGFYKKTYYRNSKNQSRQSRPNE